MAVLRLHFSRAEMFPPCLLTGLIGRLRGSFLRIGRFENSLVVQWLGLICTAVALDLIPGRGTKILQAA